jgi:hypothetical protein
VSFSQLYQQQIENKISEKSTSILHTNLFSFISKQLNQCDTNNPEAVKALILSFEKEFAELNLLTQEDPSFKPIVDVETLRSIYLKALKKAKIDAQLSQLGEVALVETKEEAEKPQVKKTIWHSVRSEAELMAVIHHPEPSYNMKFRCPSEREQLLFVKTLETNTHLVDLRYYEATTLGVIAAANALKKNRHLVTLEISFPRRLD